MNYRVKESTQQKISKETNKVKIIDVTSLMPYGSETAIFNGYEHNANVSFFLVCFSPGAGPKKHRHPYEETFIIIEGAIEAVIDGITHTVTAGSILVVPPNAWHEFTNKTEQQVMTVNIHPAAKMATEWYCG